MSRFSMLRRASSALCCGLLLSLAGCGSAERPSAVVSGEVHRDGKPLLTGVISFHGEDGRVATGAVENGEFEVTKVPLGKNRVTVQATPSVTTDSEGKPIPGPDAASFVPLPARYGDPAQSGLTAEVTSDTNSDTFELTSS
ncbi:MAG TPA: hypothetical protein VHB77_12430 [Planctomycetaceae bacterium]|nr:hypothetical protein [Planctomycetaceae bacterium]